MQQITYTIDAGLPLSLWRGIPAQLTLKGIPDTTGSWLFLVDSDWVDGVVLSGTVTASGGDLIVTLADMHTAELAHAIQGHEVIAARATLTDQTSRVYLIPLTIRNRAIEGTPPVPVEQYYTKAQIDALIAGITAEDVGALPAPAEAGTPGQVYTKTADGEAWDDLPAPPVSSVNGKTGDVALTAADVEAVSLDGLELSELTSGVIQAPGKVYNFAPTESVTMTFPAPVTGKNNVFQLRITMPDPAVAVTWPAGLVWRFAAPTLGAGTTTELAFSWTGSAWEGWTPPDMSEYLPKSGGAITDLQLTNGQGAAIITIHDGTTRDGIAGYLIGQGIGNSTIIVTTSLTRVRNSTLTLSAAGALQLESTSDIIRYNGHEKNSPGGLCVLTNSGNLTLPGDLTFTPAGGEATTLTALEARVAALEAALN